MYLALKHLKFYFLCPLLILLGSIMTLSFMELDNCDKSKFKEIKTHYRTKNLNNLSLVICILSAPKNLEKRNALRETWLSDSKQNKILYFFVVGSLGLTPDNLLHLSSEQSKYNDLLILPIEDSYSKLTNKVLQTFVWLDEQLYGELNFDYLLKCDDDSFVRLEELKNEINVLQKHLEDDNFESSKNVQSINIQKNLSSKKLNVYWGYFKGNANIKTQGKWKETNWILCSNYLPYAQGGGYILSKDLVIYIARNSEDFSLYNSEDVSVGTWLAPVSNIIRIHDVRFDTEWVSRGCQNDHIIFHNIPIKEMKTMYSNIKQNGYPCLKETIKRKKYLYDWSSHPSNCCKNLV